MSLVNQMLRDLQQQKKTGSGTKPSARRPPRLARIPYLPLPLVLSGAGLLLLCFVWWLSGVLSGVMTDAEPQLVATQPATLPAQDAGTGPEPDQLTAAERLAEPPPAAQSVAKTGPERGPAAVDVPSARQPSAVPATVTEPKAERPAVATEHANAKPVIRQDRPRPGPSAARVARVAEASPQTKPRSLRTPQQVASAPVKRLHPDELPGAIQSPRHSQPEEEMVIARPSRLPATTPFGMAEEAYLDGQWALQQKRDNLAVRSLQHALELYPGHLPARNLLVEIHTEQGKAGEAMFLLAEGLEIVPDYVPFKKQYARLLIDQGDYDAATKVMLQGGLPSVEEDPEAHVLLASLYTRLAEPFLAAQTYRNLLVSWPRTGAFWVGLGGALEAQNLHEEAVECYRRALAMEDLREDLSLYAKKRLRLFN